MAAGRTAAALLVAAALMLVAAGPVALAQSGDIVTRHRTYETALNNLQPYFFLLNCPTGYVLEEAGQEGDCDPTGQTQDGSIDVGGVAIYPDEATENATKVRVRIVDDVWGPNAVAGYACVLTSPHQFCAQDSYPPDKTSFCGDSGWELDTFDGDWHVLYVWVLGAVHQHYMCEPYDAITGGTSGGVLTEDGGIYADFVVPE